MGRITYQGRGGALRLSDGSSPPKYLELPFVQMNYSIPLASPRPADSITPTLSGYQHAPDEAAYFAPVPISFSASIDDQTNSWKLRDALGNPDMDSTWKVGTQTWTTTRGRGSIILADGASWSQGVSFFDAKKNAVNMEVLWTQPQAGSAFGIRAEEIYFAPEEQQIAESADSVEITIRGMCYGRITYQGAFTDALTAIAS